MSDYKWYVNKKLFIHSLSKNKMKSDIENVIKEFEENGWEPIAFLPNVIGIIRFIIFKKTLK